MSQAAIETLLKQKIGLNAQTIGSRTIAKSIALRMLSCSISDLTTYWKLLQTSTNELNALIEEIVIPETWFFRDQKPFEFLSQYVKKEWLPRHQEESLRVLSVPCSTGEEPYSIAITLLEAGLTSKNFHIDAVDISKNALLLAQQGIYSQNSFRGCTTAFQKKYFTKIENSYHLDQKIINSINFMGGNLLSPQFSITKKPYHIIFCRNLLIYLEQSARKQVFQVISKLLNNQGLLFLGYSETGQILPSSFVSVRYPSAFAFTKESKLQSSDIMPDRSLKNIDLPLIKKSPNSENLKRSNFPDLSNIHNNKKQLLNNCQLPNKNSTNSLEIARTFADKGELEEALNLCKTHLIENPLDAETYFLLGQVYQAKGNELQAEQSFQKVVYLDPNHYEALMHLALLKEYYGDKKSAIILRQRIERL